MNKLTEGIEIRKWSTGERPVDYFEDNGNIVTGDNFGIEVEGIYTIYTKLSDGNEYLNTFTVKPEDLLLPKLYTDVELGVVTVSYKMPELIEYVYIPDVNLRRELNRTLKKGSVESEITVAEMKTIDKFTIQKLHLISDLTGLEAMTNTSGVTMTIASVYTELLITDFSPLTALGISEAFKTMYIVGADLTKTGTDAVYQLKGKFPHLTTGGVEGWEDDSVILTLDELKYGGN